MSSDWLNWAMHLFVGAVAFQRRKQLDEGGLSGCLNILAEERR